MDQKTVRPSTGKFQAMNHGLNLKWCCSFNCHLPNGVINLSDEGKNELCFISSHTVVLYNQAEQTQSLLQGHSNAITSISFNKEKNIIITVDSGENCMMVVWSVEKAVPIRVVFNPDVCGIIAIDTSPDGKLAYTLSAPFEGSQRVRIWDWQNTDEDLPIKAEGELKLTNNLEFCTRIRANENDLNEFVTTGSALIRFWKVSANSCTSYNPKFSKKEGKKDNSLSKKFVETVFFTKDRECQAVTGTEHGALVVWNMILSLEDFGSLDQRREVKAINLFGGAKQQGISILTVHDDMLVVGTTQGSLRFYNFGFKIICWFEDLSNVEIQSISFGRFSQEPKAIEGLRDEEHIDFGEFIVSDSSGKIFSVDSKIFGSIDPEKKKANILMKGVQSPILDLSFDSVNKTIAFVCANGNVYESQMWGLNQQCIRELKEEKETREFPNTLAYSPNGEFLVLGTNQGNIYIKERAAKEFKPASIPLSQKKKGVVCHRIAFAFDSKHFAVSDDHKCVSLFKYDHKYMNEGALEWVFAGKMRAHTLAITDLCFSKSTPLKLYTIGKDRTLVQYDIESSKDALMVDIRQKIDTEFTPLALATYYDEMGEQILISNTEYKIKQFIANGEEFVCLKTVLGAVLGGPLTGMRILELNEKEFEETSERNSFKKQRTKSRYDKNDENYSANQHKKNNVSRYIVYMTSEKLIGFIKLPLNGNPNNTLAIIGHADKIGNLILSKDNKMLLTCGATDLSMNFWTIDAEGISKTSFFNNDIDHPETYRQMIERTNDGQLMRELKDFFYYSQIKTRNQHNTKAHKLDGRIPLDEVHHLMIALGSYPSAVEIDNMRTEIQNAQDNNGKDLLSLEGFIKLFVNHRPAYGLTKEYIEEIVRKTFGGSTIRKSDLFDLLTNYGEKFTEKEIEEYFVNLLGDTDVSVRVPEEFDINFLIEEVLGFEHADAVNEEEEVKS